MAVIALHSASTGLRALNTSLDVIANNLANANTDGFKASRANFEDLLYLERAQPGSETTNGDQRPTGLYVGLGTQISGTQQNFAQGPILPTGNEFDVAILGEGFFQVAVSSDESPTGLAYTRAGNFTLNSEGELTLPTSVGRVLEPAIQFGPEHTSITIGADGTVTALANGVEEEVGVIELAKFVNPAGLRQIGENLWAPSVASGDPEVGQPGTDGIGELLGQALEGSNVDPVTELVNLIRTQRAFEMNSQSIQAADDMMQTIGQLRRL